MRWIFQCIVCLVLLGALQAHAGLSRITFEPSRYPDDIWVKIFSYLDLEDVGNVARVCKHFHQFFPPKPETNEACRNWLLAWCERHLSPFIQAPNTSTLIQEIKTHWLRYGVNPKVLGNVRWYMDVNLPGDADLSQGTFLNFKLLKNFIIQNFSLPNHTDLRQNDTQLFLQKQSGTDPATIAVKGQFAKSIYMSLNFIDDYQQKSQKRPALHLSPFRQDFSFAPSFKPYRTKHLSITGQNSSEPKYTLTWFLTTPPNYWQCLMHVHIHSVYSGLSHIVRYLKRISTLESIRLSHPFLNFTSTLEIRKNSLKLLPPQGCWPKLQELSVQHISVKDIRLHHLSSLTSLTLASNDIEALDLHSLSPPKGLPCQLPKSLRELSLEDNKLNTIPKELFEMCPYLEKLNIQCNSIKDGSTLQNIYNKNNEPIIILRDMQEMLKRKNEEETEF